MALLTLRTSRDSALSWEEGDANLLALDSDSPWKVSADHITYNGKVGIGVDSTYVPVYDLDFGNGDSATVGITNGDLVVHVDGPNKLKVWNNTVQSITVNTFGKVGINDSNPDEMLTVGGNIRASNTVLSNVVSANSITDGVMSISNGRLLNVKQLACDSAAQIQFGHFYSKEDGHRIYGFDQTLTSGIDRLPTSYAVWREVDSFNSQFDSINGKLQTNVNIIDGQFDSLNGKLQTNLNIIDGQFDSLNGKLGSTDLQDVTDVGNVTTNDIKVGNLVSTGITDSAASTAITIAANGNVGIGTDNPATTLHLNSSSSAGVWTTYTNSDAPNGAVVGIASDENIRIQHGEPGKHIGFRTHDGTSIAERMRIDANGRVGIGGDPATIGGGDAKLQVAGDGYFSGTVSANWLKSNYWIPNTATRGGLLLASNGSLNPADDTGAPTDGVMDIGRVSGSTTRFRDAHFSGTVNGNTFVKTGGTSSQYLKADGSTSTDANISAGSVANSFTVQGTAFNGSSPQSVTFTGGTGITVSGTTITNDLGGTPVSIAGGGATTISGSYPAFTVSSVNTTYSAGSGLSLSGTTFTNAAPDQTVVLTGSGATTVSGTYPNFTISSTDNNTTYSAGTGLSLSGTQFTNTAPDRTVVLTGSGATTITGTYPNFTISSTDTNTNTTYTAGSGLTLSGTQFINAAPDRTVSITGGGATTVTGTYPNFTISSTDTNTNTTYTAGNGLTLSGTQFTMSGSYTGTLTCSGDVVAFSDIAVKEDINPIVGALEKISQLGGYTFKRKDDDSRKYTGVIAQEVKKVLPEAVHGDKDGELAVAYGNLTGLLIEAVKELSAKVKELESK